MAIQIKLRAIVPRGKVLDPELFERNLKDALDHSINIIGDDFEKTTATWSHKPNFVRDGAKRRGDDLVAKVWTKDKRYLWVTHGTRPRIIRPRRARMLAFRTGFSAKTSPGVISSRGGRSFGPWAFARAVRHPGIRARNFDITIERRREKNVRTLVTAAFAKSIRNPGSTKVG